MEIGDVFSTSKTITDAVVQQFAEISGDFNPLHLDEEFAKKTRFGTRIAHGMISGALISAVLGFNLGGKTVVYLTQSLKFVAPVFIDDTVTATATVLQIRKDKPIVTLETTCKNQDAITIVEGEAVVLLVT